MKYLFASDSLKGSLSSDECNRLLAQAAREVFPECRIKAVSMADGGEGTMDAVMKTVVGRYRTVEVENPLGMPVLARYGILPDGGALIEMAEASGLCLVPEPERNPLRASSFGTGQLIKDALDQGIRNITIAIGGSATNDGGMGAMSALGVRFLDGEGKILKGCGAELEKVEEIQFSEMHPEVKHAQFTVMCDVNNPLLGPEGAVSVFGAQKGADFKMQEKLENGMTHFAEVVEGIFHTDFSRFPGSGAAGGMGAALKVFLGAKIESGIGTVLALTKFDEELKDTDCVITGEGRIDGQSVRGKVISGIAERCALKGIPVIVLAGSMGEGAEEAYQHGIHSIFTMPEGPCTLEYSISHAEELYRSAARRMFRLLKAGYVIANKTPV